MGEAGRVVGDVGVPITIQPLHAQFVAALHNDLKRPRRWLEYRARRIRRTHPGVPAVAYLDI